MREIKYQAWHKREKRMYLVAGMLKDIVMLETGLDGLMGCNIDEVELREFTGLKDRHGKEIYEGDVIKCFNGLTSSSFNAVVRWEEQHIQDDCSDVPLLVAGFIIGSLGEVEIIGNIYEHPELMR